MIITISTGSAAEGEEREAVEIERRVGEASFLWWTETIPIPNPIEERPGLRVPKEVPLHPEAYQNQNLEHLLEKPLFFSASLIPISSLAAARYFPCHGSVSLHLSDY
ncbi:hypothetical protein KFK09_019769 [Dendrobium nobile]|uniref:Uncharacterized protein n=1 Tax=Dendrobium nobile TaxID=94219 RepID=A0A8T3ARY8_DENNO|nr:hypothetical protein KFK09_019769 [Dendrobium nobile]